MERNLKSFASLLTLVNDFPILCVEEFGRVNWAYSHGSPLTFW